MSCPLPRYWMCHIVIAMAIGVVLAPFSDLVAGLLAGMFFYVGREFTQWEQGGGPGRPFDWKGLIAPILACCAVWAAVGFMA